MVAIVGSDQTILQRRTCNQCGSILEFAPSEVLRGKITDYTGGTDVYKYIKCLKCGHEVKV